MAVTLEELELKFKSEIAAATSKDEAALSRVDAAVRKSAEGLKQLQAIHAANAGAARKAEASGVIADAQKARAREAASAGKLAGAFAQDKSLQQNVPRLKALAKESAAAKANAAEMKRLAKARDDASDAAKSKAVEASQAAMLGAAGAAATLTAALVVGYGAFLSYGFAAAGAARDARILGEALTGSAKLGAEFNAVVNQLSSKVPLAKEKIAGLAQEFSLLKLGRRDLQAGLTSVAIVTSALGDSAGGAVKSIVAASAASRRFSLGMRDRFGELTGLAGTGLKKADVLGALAKQLKRSVPEVEKELLSGRITMAAGLKALEAAAQGRFGKTIAGQMLSFDTQITKAKENLAGMFAGVDIEPALNGFKDLLSVFDQSTVDGALMKTALTLGLQSISNGLGVVLPLARTFITEFTIGALEIYLALRPIGRKIQEWIGPIDGASVAITAAKVAVYGLAAVFGVLAIGAAAAVALLATPFVVVGAAIYGLVVVAQAAWGMLKDGASAAADWVIDGLVGGLARGVGKVVGAFRDLASSGLKSFESFMQIGSPSRRMGREATYTVQGYTNQLEREKPAVGEALAGLGDATPDVQLGGGARPRGGSAGGAVNLHIENVYFAGKKASAQDKQDLVDMLLEQLGFAQGAGSAGRPVGAT